MNRGGYTPDECPYKAHHDPFVAEVIRAYRACSEGGMGLAILCPDPPAVLVAGLDAFGLELNRARAWDHERREQERKARSGEADG